MGKMLSSFPCSCDKIFPRRFGGSLGGNGVQRDNPNMNQTTRIKQQDEFRKTFHSTYRKEEELWKLK